MPGPEASFGWQEALAALVAITAAAFLVSWVATDLLHVRRGPYISVLALTVLALGAGYLALSGTSARELVVSGWGWGLIAGGAAALILTPMVRRLPAGEHARGGRLLGLFAWEGVVYGSAEAVLLATLPVLAAWQAMSDLGWTDGAWEKAASGALAIGSALVLILVHHLGYAEYRRRAARKELGGVLVGCGIQAVAFLVTGNILAPILAHVVLHGQLILRGHQMPPAEIRPEPSGSSGEGRIRPREREDVLTGIAS